MESSSGVALGVALAIGPVEDLLPLPRSAFSDPDPPQATSVPSSNAAAKHRVGDIGYSFRGWPIVPVSGDRLVVPSSRVTVLFVGGSRFWSGSGSLHQLGDLLLHLGAPLRQR